MLTTITSCVSRDASKVERKILLEGKFDCETQEYYQAYSKVVQNTQNEDPKVTMTYEEYVCARYKQVPKGKEVLSFEYFQKLRGKNPETIDVMFIPCKYVQKSQSLCKN